MTKLKTKQVKLTTLRTKSQLNSIVVDKYGRPDYLAINLYWDSFRSWYNPKIPYKKGNNIYYLSKLKTKGIFLDYKTLAEAHGCSRETIRKKLVKLEQLELIHRSFQHRETVTTKSYNKLIVYVWKDTPHFYNKLGVDYEKVKLNPHTNHEYIAEKYKREFAENLPQEHTVLKRGGIQVCLDTKELNNYSSKKNIDLCSQARMELNSNSNVSNKNNSTSENNSGKNDTTENVDATKMVGKGKVIASSTLPSENSNQRKLGKGGSFYQKERKPKTVNLKQRKYQKPKDLSDMLELINSVMCKEIIWKSGRLDFTENFVMQTVEKLVKKPDVNPIFHSLKGFIAYMSWCLKHELHDAVKCSSHDFRFKSNIEDDKVDQKVSNPAEKPNTKPLRELPQRKTPDLPDTLLGKIRQQLIELYEDDGISYDTHWFSKMQPIIDEEAKTFKLRANSEMATDWIKNNCLQRLKNATASVGLELLV